MPHYTVAAGAQRCQALDSSTGPHFEDEVYVFFRKECQEMSKTTACENDILSVLVPPLPQSISAKCQHRFDI